jgi:hypothetical protein
MLMTNSDQFVKDLKKKNQNHMIDVIMKIVARTSSENAIKIEMMILNTIANVTGVEIIVWKNLDVDGVRRNTNTVINQSVKNTMTTKTMIRNVMTTSVAKN